ncbi:hypothetical protein FJT64_008960 [Amphibalanus amphitrite]|uniref:Uncharacterized protein n=1 Tax=Amphibalanus amphitrite TaxID=1232801 RepID=A0A6A4VJ63_AMPAM|nr:hypothetical protein FJT64_008960 [Amphibalanus amphitrite]
MINLTPEAQILLNPFSWAGALNALLIRQFGFTLADLVAFLVLSFVFWKVLVLFILPGIYFRVMLYTDEMESQHHSSRGLPPTGRPAAQVDCTLTQVVDP